MLASIALTISLSSADTFPPGDPIFKRKPLFTEAAAAETGDEFGTFCTATNGNAKRSITALTVSLTPFRPPPATPVETSSCHLADTDITTQPSIQRRPEITRFDRLIVRFLVDR
ncbi:hypothetical protein LXL04_030272 [Taraxacum kok-saghyz]